MSSIDLMIEHVFIDTPEPGPTHGELIIDALDRYCDAMLDPHQGAEYRAEMRAALVTAIDTALQLRGWP